MPGCTAYAFIPPELRKRTAKRVMKCIFVGYASDMKAYILTTMDGIRFTARNVYFNETELPMQKIEKTAEDSIDENKLMSFFKNQPRYDQIIDEHMRDETVAGVTDNINPKILTLAERLKHVPIPDVSKGGRYDEWDDENEESDNDDKKHDDDNDNADHETRHTDTNLMIYDEQNERDLHAAEKILREGEKVTRAQRTRVPSSQAIRNTANRIDANERARASRPAHESNETIARLAIADDAIDRAEEKAMIANAMNMRDMIGKRIDILTDIHEHALATRVHDATNPKTRKQMLTHADGMKWVLGERNELEAFARLEVLRLVDRPEGKNVMKSGWVYDTKLDLNGNVVHKARLVAKGYSQVQGMDFFEVFSPTMQTKTFRTLLALAANDTCIETETWDVSTAFLYAPMDEEVYVEQPEGYAEHGKEKVYRMMKSMYGTKQASRNWHATVDKALTDIGFKQSKNDSCLYMLRVNGKFVNVVIHVDDFAVFHNDAALCASVYAKLDDRFKMKRGPLTYFLGMRVCKHMDGSYSLDQEKYTNAILKRFNMNECKPLINPEDANVKLSMKHCPATDDEMNEMRSMPYSALAGSLQYLVVGTRPDIAHAASQTSRFMQNPGKTHWDAALRVLRYLKGTYDFRLWFTPDGVELCGYTDADYAGCIDTRRSTSGYIVKIGSTAVAWQCKQQACVALSSCESEYVAACTGAKQVVWMRRLLNELNVKQHSDTTIIYVDNEAARQLSENPIHHDRTKHIDTQYHYLRDLLAQCIVKLVHVSTVDEEADILTKEYVGPVFAKLRDRAMGRMAKRAMRHRQSTHTKASRQ